MRILYMILLGVITSFSATAQNTFPQNGYVGVGTLNPQFRLHMLGGHGDTNFSLQYDNGDPTRQANLTLWASEPGWTYTGTGIGNNVFNSSTGSMGVVRINNLKGGSYIRLLDQELRFNLVNLNGVDMTAMNINPLGDVGIGTTNSQGYKLAVNGKIRTQEVKVEAANWPDYVFARSYQLPTLTETEKHIKEKGHLPGIPSAAEVKANGIDIGEMNAKLLQKIEELTLHLIEMKKENLRQQSQIDSLKVKK